MSEKRVNEYEISFKQVRNSNGEPVDGKYFDVIFQNHDDIFKIIEIISEKKLFKEPSHAEQFVIGLKFFGDIMMKNRDLELFSEMQPAFISFMKKLKD